ncbi:MAG: hypothetical protein U0840_15545 [Gemmataceae bacterium]
MTGLDDTILRANWFNVPDRQQVLRRHLPTSGTVKAELPPRCPRPVDHGNVYAVWLTVGFFEVTDDSVTPARLGLEIGKDENKHVRYRMFAIVDRTNLSAFETTSSDAFSGFTAGQERQLQLPWVTKAGPPAQPPPYNIADVRTGREWTVTNNVYLTFDPNTDNEETVRAYTNGSGQLVAVFQRTHGNGCKVICRGNPGPMSRYDPRNDIDVVPFFMLID